ncbi:hypothetical protein D9615_003180 [Tricholomella constricta]|uniref:Reverse transcriptase domain-containing protein n=1 Tax=Tricholomella constricta TaxID=117010 RepID=A0A8H5M822_9AGAR|nr:hypothetical protein D9615_003180 [Tricholomella constricta]
MVSLPVDTTGSASASASSSTEPAAQAPGPVPPPAPSPDAAATASAPAPTPVDATATLSTLLSLIAGVMAAQNQGQPAAPSPATVSFPAFVSTDAFPAGKSLPNLFPSIETSTLLDIARHEFRPIDLCKLDSRYRNKADVDRLEGTAPRSSALKDYPSLHSLLTPLTMYFAVLQAFAAMAGNTHATFIMGHAAARYITHLLELHQRYEWSAVVQYHMQFHLHRRQEMLTGSYTGWSQPDNLLMTEYLFGRQRSSTTASTPSRISNKPKTDISSQTCFAFNKGSCTTTPCPNGRIHKCPPPVLAPPSRTSPPPFTPNLPHRLLFAPGLPPLLRPNSDPRANTFRSSSPSPPPVPSRLVHDAWSFYLADYPDRTFVDSLLNIIQFGANIGFLGDNYEQSCKNLKSASEAADFTSTSIQSLLDNSHAAGPYPSPPLPKFRCSPLGAVGRKRNPGKLRMINHLSWPQGRSVNDGIPDCEAHIVYDMFGCAVRDLRHLGTGALMAKLDLKEAFRHIPIRAADWHLLGFHWGAKFYHLLVLAFGLKSAPYIFNLFAEALHWIIQRHIPAALRHYLDDFLLIFHPSSDPLVCNAAIEWVTALGNELGLAFQDSKTVHPCTQLEFLGLELDSLAMEARLPSDKLAYLTELLDTWALKKQCTLRELQALTGFLQFASQVIPKSRTFIRRLFDFSCTFTSPFATRHIPKSAMSDIHWWRTFSSHWNGVMLITPSLPSLSIYTDASGSKGLGGIMNDQWFSARTPRRHRPRDIQFKEIFAVLHAILCWGDNWSGHHITFFCDNGAVVAWLNSGTAKSPHAMPVVRAISMMAAYLKFSYSSVWIPTEENALADAASRFQYTRLLQLAPHLSPKPSSRKSQLIGLKRTLTCQKSYIDFVRLHPAVLDEPGKYLPATDKSIVEWACHLGDRGLQPKTIKSYLSAVRSLHVDEGLPFAACESETVRRVIRGIKRYRGERERSPKLPITPSLLQRLASISGDLSDGFNVSFDAAIKTAWSGFLRCGEFTLDRGEKFNTSTHLSRGCVTFLPSFAAPTHVRLDLPASKTDPFRKGVSILIAKAPEGSTTCAVSALHHLFTSNPQPLDAPLFSNPDGSPLTRADFVSTLKQRLTSLGINASLYSGHSFRRGAASAAAAVGFADFEIQLLGRWRSDAYKLYIDVPRERILGLSARLHLAVPPAQPFVPPDLLFAPLHLA